MKNVAICIMGLCIFINIILILYLKKKNANLGKEQEKYVLLYKCCTKWLRCFVINKKLTDFLCGSGYTNIAIYGMGELGKIFYDSVKDDERIKVLCFIESSIDGRYSTEMGVDVVGIENLREFKNLNAVIITPIFDSSHIKNKLTGYPALVSLDELIDKLEKV